LPDLDWGTGFLRLVAVARFFAFRPPSAIFCPPGKLQ
jgi:hypothetical protein